MSLRRKLILSLSGLLFLAASVTANAAPVVVTGVGGTERAALHDAMRRAVEQEAGAYIDGKSYVEHETLINDRINTQTSGFIAGYKVLESSEAYGMWTVKISAEVNDERLSAFLTPLQKKALVAANMADPRIAVIATDEYNRVDYELQNNIIKGLKNQGFTRLIDMGQANSALKRRIARADFFGDAALRKTLLTEFPVDYLVIATGTEKIQYRRDPYNYNVRSSGNTGGMGRAQTTITVRMVNANNGEIVYADSVTADARGMNAATRAAKRAVTRVVDVLGQAALEKAADPTQHIRLLITNNALGGLSDVYDRLTQLPGVINVYTRSSSFGNIEADIDFTGTAADFAQLLTYEKIPVRELSAEHIVIGR